MRRYTRQVPGRTPEEQAASARTARIAALHYLYRAYTPAGAAVDAREPAVRPYINGLLGALHAPLIADPAAAPAVVAGDGAHPAPVGGAAAELPAMPVGAPPRPDAAAPGTGLTWVGVGAAVAATPFVLVGLGIRSVYRRFRPVQQHPHAE